MNRALDVLGVYLLPVLCFALDYRFNFFWAALYPLTIWTFAGAGAMAFALSRRTISRPNVANMAAGAMLVAGAGAGLVAVPVFLAGVFWIAGLLTTGNPLFAWALFLPLVPVLAANRLVTRAWAVLRTAPWSGRFIAAGAGAILLPTSLALVIEVRGDQQRKADLLSGNRNRILRALARSSWYGPRDILQRPADLAYEICPNVSALPLDDPEVEIAVRKVLGGPPNETVAQLCKGSR